MGKRNEREQLRQALAAAQAACERVRVLLSQEPGAEREIKPLGRDELEIK